MSRNYYWGEIYADKNKIIQAQNIKCKNNYCTVKYTQYIFHLKLLVILLVYPDVLFVAKLKFNCFHLSQNDFDIRVSNQHNNRFISLASYSCVTYYFYTVRTIRLWNSLHNNVTASQTIYYVLRRLLSIVNFIPYLLGHV